MKTRVLGRVIDPNGAPVAGARVVVTSAPIAMPEIAMVTDKDGRFALALPAEGEYGLAAHGDPGVAHATVRAGGTVRSIDDPDADVSSREDAPPPGYTDLGLEMVLGGPR